VQSTCAPITRAPVIADVRVLYENMTHVHLVSLSHRTTFSDLLIGYRGLEIKSQGDECVFSRVSCQFTVEAVRSSKKCFNVSSVSSC
jgi:hypothetical protein